MNLHEYQAKQLFTKYGINVPDGKPAYSVNEALRHAGAMGEGRWVVKAQVHAGGRGKAGGVRLVSGMAELKECVQNLLGSQLITKQSGPKGNPVNCVLIQSCHEIVRELYLGMLVDRGSKRITVVVSTEGGMDIEQVAATHADKIISLSIDPAVSLQPYQIGRLAFALDLDAGQRQQFAVILQGLYRLFIERDLSLVEINPLIINAAGDLLALDAKIVIDDNALYRQTTLKEWRDPSQEDETERAAKRFDLNYVTLTGDIACIVNGAGLAMATMDIIKLHGGEPANFLDVGGGTNADKVAEAFKLIVSDRKIQAILVNIFGGIVRCDLIAEGVVKAVHEVGVNVPVVVRLAGTNMQKGKQVLADSGLSVIAAEDLADAADKVVAAAQTAKS